MIVVDSNVVAYCWIRGVRSETAQRVRLRDPAWHVPILWRYEVRSALSSYVWHGTLEPDGAAAIMATAGSSLAGCEHLVASGAVAPVEIVGDGHGGGGWGMLTAPPAVIRG